MISHCAYSIVPWPGWKVTITISNGRTFTARRKWKFAAQNAAVKKALKWMEENDGISEHIDAMWEIGLA